MGEATAIRIEGLAAYVRTRWLERGLQLTVREIQAEFGLSSPSVALYWINKAFTAGLLIHTEGITRSILPTDWRAWIKEAV